ncbi:MAG TPA: hypothetical protein VFW19_10660 [Allosphingosinicella sp.]|nr:hypothetical protein [Allosphingosinicella sp.]
MPRLPADPVGRLAKLEALRTELKRGTVLNAAELGQVLGISWRFLKQMIDDDQDFPVMVRGDMGVPWEFDARKVVDHLIKQARSAQAERERRMAETARLAGLVPAGDVSSLGDRSRGGPGSAAQTLEEARALDALLNVQAKVRAEKERQNALLDRAGVQAFLWRWLSGLQSEVLAIQQRLERRADLSVDVKQIVPDELASILVAMRAALEREIVRQNAPRP